MRLQLYNIIPALQPYIKLICSMNCDGDADTHHIRVLPDTCVELFINYTSTPIATISNELYKRSIVTFRMTKPMDVQMRKGSGCLAVCFHPGMAYHFFQPPMHLLSDSTTALADLWKNKAAEIEEQLAGAVDNHGRAKILQSHLMELLAGNKHDSHIEFCLKQVQASGGLNNVGDLADCTGLSQRHLSRKFQRYVGLPPKEYLRVCRFLRSLSYLKKYPDFSLTTIAYESGYYDQAHFSREYKAYTGYTPREVVNAKHILY
ncbi:helix-turn-helix domain-containing protein [Paradesertivirga mongoliensis]|uniref:Helix-turn-helix domain-containing protein n=1 Tax=Paradesertivirga mongoliensis TaxID=2100740 RepID=A0ABW4ZHM5_9SPHI|nr:helix-turn-helix domain-containing protein [Pedobacter mongoliensis]